MKAPRFHVYQDKAGAWRWRLKAANGRLIAESGEAYTRRPDACRAVGVVIETIQSMDKAFGYLQGEQA